MPSRPPFAEAPDLDDLDFGPGPYDGLGTAEEDADLSNLDADLPAFDRLNGPDDLHLWRAAQGGLAVELAEVVWRCGQLAARLKMGPAGGARRLAMLEVADLGWWAGEHIGLDRLTLAAEDRLTGVQDQSLALSALLWSVRRLVQPLGVGADGAGIAAFLGRAGAEVRAVETVLRESGLHPVVRGAVVFHLWRASGAGGLARDLEAAVLGSRIAGDLGGGAGFVPLALSSGIGLRASGGVEQKLHAWLRGAGQATGAALLHLDRLSDWRMRAQEAVAGLSGRTPEKLVTVFEIWPVVSAPLAERETGASRAAVQRNLEILEEKRLIREMTGQARFRHWTARI